MRSALTCMVRSVVGVASSRGRGGAAQRRDGTARGLRIPVAVGSNIGWDMRRVFRDHGVDDLVDAFFLSFECGVKKPDPRIFQMACDKLGVAPGDALMVGDEPLADAGAAMLGCRVHLGRFLQIIGSLVDVCR
ncbi:HAD family hydrolase [Streptomyces albidocamelliae]|uniref:HAD family hydrolase n=1 Tax=Streptomyces albidocamelliae TaxID=2981135 RepID=UPI00384F721C